MNLIETQLPITEVVAYPSSAMITRSRRLSFKQGENKIVIKKLPETLSLDTVRIETGTGREIDIIDIFVEDSYTDTHDENRYKAAKSDLDILLTERMKLETRFRGLNEEFLLFLEKDSLVDSVREDKFRTINVKNWSEFFAFMDNQLSANRKKARETVFEWLEANRKIASAEQNLARLESYDRIKEHSVCVTVKCQKDLEETTTLRYLAGAVEWYPAYSIRAGADGKMLDIAVHAMVSQATGEDWENISLLLSTAIPLSCCDIPELKSQRIMEQSADAIILPGTATNRAEMKESADYGSDGAIDRKADAYEAEEQSPAAERSKARSVSKKAKGKMAPPPAPKSIPASYAAGAGAHLEKTVMTEVSRSQAEQPKDIRFGGMDSIMSLVREVEGRVFSSIPVAELVEYYNEYDYYMGNRFVPEDSIPEESGVKVNPAFASGVSPLSSLGGFDYRYKVAGKVESIRSIGTQVQIGVDTLRCPMELSYVTVPVVSEAVFLKTSFANTYLNPLPQGPAQIFSGNNFLGNIQFPTLGRNERSSLSLGIDRDIKVVRREKSERKTGGFVRKEIVTGYSVEIELASYKEKEVTIDVYERIPISEKPKEVEVEGVTYSDEPRVVTKRNIVIFRVTLAPGGKKKIEVSYLVRHPEDYRLSLRYADHPHLESEGDAR